MVMLAVASFWPAFETFETFFKLPSVGESQFYDKIRYALFYISNRFINNQPSDGKLLSKFQGAVKTAD